MKREIKLSGIFKGIKEYSSKAKEAFDAGDTKSAIEYIKIVEKEIKRII